MQKKLLFGLALLLQLLTACRPVQPQAEPPRASGGVAQLTFLISGDPTDEAAYQALIDAFSLAHGDIAVDLVNVPSSGDFRKRLTADIAAGTPPDVFLINYRRYGAYAANGAIEPLTPYLNQSTLIQESDYYPQALAAFTWEGALACMPQNISSPVIFYNKALFDAAGVAYPSADWTWDEFVQTAQALTADQDNDGIVDVYGFGTEASIVRMAPFIWMNGGELVDDPAAPTKLTLDTPENKAALEWYIALQTTHKVVPDAAAEEAESSESRFLNGRLAMFIESRRAVPEFRAIKDFDWDVAALPVGKQQASVLHSDAYCMAAAGKQKDATWTFIEFANTTAGQTILAQTGRTVPSLKALAESAVYLDPQAKPANSRAFLDAIPGMRNLPVIDTWNDIEGILNTELGNAFYGHVTLEEAIQAANEHSAEFFK